MDGPFLQEISTMGPDHLRPYVRPLLATLRPLAKMVSALLVPTSRGGLVMPLDFSECPAIRTSRSRHLRYSLQCDIDLPGSRTLLRCSHYLPRAITLPAGHQLPSYSREFIGKCNCDQFWWLAFDELLQPRPAPSFSAPHLTDHSRGTHDQGITQRFVACLRDRSQSVLSSSGMVFRCQANPCRKMTCRFEAVGSGVLRASIVAPMVPMPGICASRWDSSFRRWRAASSMSIFRMRA